MSENYYEFSYEEKEGYREVHALYPKEGWTLKDVKESVLHVAAELWFLDGCKKAKFYIDGNQIKFSSADKERMRKKAIEEEWNIFEGKRKRKSKDEHS